MIRNNESAVPWYIWCAVISVTSAMVGTHWDIAWHRSIGRDTFWTPAHMAIYFAGVLAGLSCGYLILATTFAKDAAAQQASVKMWGFRGPLGAFICAWGGVAMIASAPFDNWWHNAYGLDVKVLSPPHVVLIAGIIAIDLGALILILGNMNRAQGARAPPAQLDLPLHRGDGPDLPLHPDLRVQSATLHARRPILSRRLDGRPHRPRRRLDRVRAAAGPARS